MSAKKGWFASLFGRGDDDGKRQVGDSHAGAQGQPDAATSGEWHLGQTVLDDYVVERVLGEGGMGKVYLLKSRTTGTLFAVKRAKGLSERDRRNFLAELQTWIDLPEHANLVPCRFFRTVDNEVLIFAEYVDGGSLKDWIDSRKLYEGGAEKTLERILDAAIQFAWGLHCVHEFGLVHQDVKPANVMMEKDAEVAVQGMKLRVTDYGLARARAASGEQHVPEIGQSILVSSGGYTPAYCSPEQADGRKLDRRTDVWSWGVSVMEMFQGGATWHSGKAAAQALESFLENNGEETDIPAMPEGVAELLARCFREDPSQRWQSLEAVVQKLKGVYRATVGTEYVRALREVEHRHAPQVGAGERRTREGASWTDPREWLERALREEGRDPAEAVEIVARYGGSRRGQLVADVAVYDEARRMYERLIKDGRKDLENELATLCHDAAPVHETVDDSSGALALYDRAIEIRERLVNVEGRRELANDLVALYTNKANAVGALGDYRAAMALYDRAIEVLEGLVNIVGPGELANRLTSKLAGVYSNKANTVGKLGDDLAAIGLYDRAIEIRKRLLNIEGWRELADDLAGNYVSKANAVSRLGDYLAAVGLYDQGIEIRERLVNVDGRRELANDLAAFYLNKAIAVDGLGDSLAAVSLYDMAIQIREQLINVEGRSELANDLAILYMNKAIALRGLGETRAAMDLYDRAGVIYERLVNIEGRRELASELATFYRNKAHAVGALGDALEAAGLYDRAIEIVDRLVNVEGRRELVNNLATLYSNQAITVGLLQDHRAAVGLYDRTIEILDRLTNVEGRRELVGDLARVKALRAVALLQLGDTERGEQEAHAAMIVLREEVNRTSRTDLKAALDWTAQRLDEHEKAVAKRDIEARFNLGVMHEKGQGVPKDERKAVLCYEEAAAQGLAEAQFNLGAMYEEGRGVPKDERKAVLCYQQAADQGFANAQFNLGLMYANGEGIPKDERKAVEFFEKAAAQGLANAQFNLGFMYANGRGVSKDDRRAVEWYEKAAAQGYASAYFNLGWMYVDGQGVPRDDVQAYAQFSVAVALGHSGAAENLALMNPHLPQSKKNEAQVIAKRIFDSLKNRAQKMSRSQ